MSGDSGPFHLVRHYSLANVALKSPSNEYDISGMFGAIAKRKLKPRLSDTLGVSEQHNVKISAEDSKAATKAQRAKAKAKPVGKVALRAKAKSNDNQEAPAAADEGGVS